MSGKILNGDLEVIKASNVEVEVAEEDALKFKNDPPQGNPTVIGKNQGDLSPGQPVEVKWTGRRGGEEMMILGNVFKDPREKNN